MRPHDFLTSELERLRPERQAGEQAILNAVHHPPLSVDAKSGGSTGLSLDIDSCCKAAGQWPDALLSGRARLDQSFTRMINGRQPPYIGPGSGAVAATPPQQAAPPAGTEIGDHTLEVDPIIQFGYLTLTTDAKTLTVAFKTAPRDSPETQMDFVTLDLVGEKSPPAAEAGSPDRRRNCRRPNRT